MDMDYRRATNLAKGLKFGVISTHPFNKAVQHVPYLNGQNLYCPNMPVVLSESAGFYLLHYSELIFTSDINTKR